MRTSIGFAVAMLLAAIAGCEHDQDRAPAPVSVKEVKNVVTFTAFISPDRHGEEPSRPLINAMHEWLNHANREVKKVVYVPSDESVRYGRRTEALILIMNTSKTP